MTQVDYPLFVAPKPHSFDLNEEMLATIEKEFNVADVAQRFAAAIAGKAPEEVTVRGKELFAAYGESWMKRTLQLGEEYPDRTYEILRAAADKTGALAFPHILQRFLEIAYLATQESTTLPIVENNQYRLIYRVPRCSLYRAIKEQAGEGVAAQMPCRGACLTALETCFQGLGMDAVASMTAETAKDGYCEFMAKKG